MEKIFVIGRNRSGTKWLTNILANHKSISAVQREGAGGILECSLIRNFPKYFDLENIEEKTAFEILFKKSNFHQCSGVKDEMFDQLNYANYLDLFEKYIAETQNTSCWVQKAGSYELPALYENFNDARFIIIQRNIFYNVVSSLLLKNDSKKISTVKIIKSVVEYWRHNKIEDRFKNKQNVLVINYEDLKKHTEKNVLKVCTFLNIKYAPEMVNVSYSPNTSFKKVGRKNYYTNMNKLKIKFISGIVSLSPLWFLNLNMKTKQKKGKMFQTLSFEIYRKKTKQQQE